MIPMFDDTDLGLVPATAGAVAGYVNGRWPTYGEAVRRWPKAKHLSIAVSSDADADTLDVEPGDATNAVAANWVKRQLARGVKRPVVYTSASNATALIKALAVGGVMRSQIRLWTAHYTGHEHLCGPSCGFGPFNADATQWTDRALGRSLDESVCRDDFFGTPAPKRPSHRQVLVRRLKARKGFWAWLAWYLGREDWKPFGPRNPLVRPAVPKRISRAWWIAERAFLKAGKS